MKEVKRRELGPEGRRMVAQISTAQAQSRKCDCCLMRKAFREVGALEVTME